MTDQDPVAPGLNSLHVGARQPAWVIRRERFGAGLVLETSTEPRAP
jgi:hypothetical protein